jgi:hypothetical protein
MEITRRQFSVDASASGTPALLNNPGFTSAARSQDVRKQPTSKEFWPNETRLAKAKLLSERHFQAELVAECADRRPGPCTSYSCRDWFSDRGAPICAGTNSNTETSFHTLAVPRCQAPRVVSAGHRAIRHVPPTTSTAASKWFQLKEGAHQTGSLIRREAA